MPRSDTVYILINKQAGTALDLNLADLKTVACYPRGTLDNQKWRFIKKDDHWVIQNVLTNKYLGVESPGTPENGNKIICVKTDSPLEWEVRGDVTGDGWQIVYKDSSKIVDLEGGLSAPGTTVFLYEGWNGPNQVWRLEEINRS